MINVYLDILAMKEYFAWNITTLQKSKLTPPVLEKYNLKMFTIKIKTYLDYSHIQLIDWKIKKGEYTLITPIYS